MAFDQNAIPVDLRPINVVHSSGEEARIVTTSGRPIDGFYPNSNPVRLDVANSPSVPMYFTDASTAGFPGMGYVIRTGQGAWWSPQTAAPVGPSPSSSSSFSISSSGYAYSPNVGSRVSRGGNSTGLDQVIEDGADDSVSGKKVKFLCSFGGKILPRPSDGMLRYVGGQTRIISVRRDVTFEELVQKMMGTYGQEVVIKYQLPDEDLDALVSVSCSDDLDNMMEEYEKLKERSPDGSAKLRVFLFSASELDPSGLVQLGGSQDTGQRYMDAVNGVAEGIVGGITRKESIASLASTQNSDVSGSEAFETSLAQDVNGLPSTSMFSPQSISSASYDNAPRLEISATPLLVPPRTVVPPHSVASQPEIEMERSIPVQAIGLQQSPMGYDLPQPSINMQPIASPYLGGYIDPHQDALNRGASQVYANRQGLGASRPIIVQQQYCDSASNLMNQQYLPTRQMTMAPPSSHLSMNPNILRPQVQSTHRVVAIPTDSGYSNAYQAPLVGGYGWPQAPPPLVPQDHASFPEGYMPPHQQAVPTAVADCYMCQKVLPHAHSDSVVQDQKVTQSSYINDPIPVHQSLRLDDVTRLYAATPQNKGLMGLATDAQTPYNVTVSSQDVNQQRQVASSYLQNEPSVSKPSNGDNDNGVPYHARDQFVPDSSNISSVPSRENAVKSVISRDHARAVEDFQNKSSDILPTNEPGKSEPFLPQTMGRETFPNAAFSRPELFEQTSPMKQSEMVPCSVPEVQYQGNEFSPRHDMRSDVARFPIEPISPHNWGVIGNDSPNSLFRNQDTWNVRHETHFPPPKPGKIVTKREASAADNRQNGELIAEVNLVEVTPTAEQVQSGKGSAEELIKQQLQATAEGVAASVLYSSVSSNVDFPTQETSVSEGNIGIEGQTDDETVIQTKIEAMNIKSDKTKFGFPLSNDLGRLQIIKNSDLEELRELGSGTFGTVYHGKWRGTDVAIKRINDRCFAGKPSEEERMRNDFWNEAINLADLHHPNVVAFYGVVLDGPGGSVATVTEYMVNGSLRTALQSNERSLDKRKKLLVAMDVAFGMEYLHSKNIVHFDIKSDNLLVNLRDPHRPICKVGDLGLSKVKHQTLVSGGVRGTLPWMAPELMNGSGSLVSDKVDVFSFGIVMWELLTGDEPYADLHYGAILGGIMSNTLRPPVPENCDPDWRSLMERCWAAEPLERPTFTEIANKLRSMASKITAKAQTPATMTKPNS
ncbi:uncharacterized protein LOC130828924 [Amaranthus tricolor]|uniref:uncharacterized protein LOC130828924 n=1 Tax=Amaranthus tricolor TaxID=29722 RepID=UPI0025894C4F|nr:uncharacterized protein LOC130828924 [Amaranthus tricolor]